MNRLDRLVDWLINWQMLSFVFKIFHKSIFPLTKKCCINSINYLITLLIGPHVYACVALGVTVCWLEISSAETRGCHGQRIYLVTDPNHLTSTQATGRFEQRTAWGARRSKSGMTSIDFKWLEIRTGVWWIWYWSLTSVGPWNKNRDKKQSMFVFFRMGDFHLIEGSR